MALEELENRASFLEQRTKINEAVKMLNIAYEFNPTDSKYGAIGDYDEQTKSGTDNTAAFNAMMDDVREKVITAVAPSIVKERYLVRVTVPEGRYMCNGSLNFTGLRGYGWVIEFKGAEIVSKAEGFPAIEARGSRYGRFTDAVIYGHEAARPSIGVAIGRDSVGNTCDLFHFDNLTLLGEYTLTGLYNCASETCTFIGTHIHNRLGGLESYCLIQDGKSDFEPASEFITPSPLGRQHSFNENVFISLDARHGKSGPAIYLSRTAGHKFYAGYAVSADDSVIVIDSNDFGTAGLYLDIHCESANITPGSKNAIRFQGDAEQVHKGFTFIEHGSHATESIIKIDADGAYGDPITSIKFMASEISVFDDPPTKQAVSFFSHPETVEFDGELTYLFDKVLSGFNIARMNGTIKAINTGFDKPISGVYKVVNTETGVETSFPSGSYTPTIDFDTTGDLSVAYTNQTGYFTVNGNTCHVSIRLVFTPTYTTAAGNVKISLPVLSLDEVNVFSSLNLSSHSAGLAYPAGCTSIDGYISRNSTFANIRANGSGQGFSDLTVSELPSGTQQIWTISGSYLID